MYIWLGDSLVHSTRNHETELPRPYSINPSPILDAVLQMAEGDSVTLYETLDREPKGFSGLKTVRHEIVIVDILTTEEVRKLKEEREIKKSIITARAGEISALVKSSLTDYNTNKLTGKLKKSTSGLEYLILEEGTGEAVRLGDQVATHYYGILKSDGQMFDNSFDRGQSGFFKVGELISGFNEGMMLLKRGGKAILFIPAALAYGKQGAGSDIPPNADLVFYIEL